MTKFAETLVNSLKQTIKDSEDSNKRIVRKLEVIDDGIFHKVVITSDDGNGWAEDIDKEILTTVRNLDFSSAVGKPESFIKDVYGTDFDEFMAALDLLYSDEGSRKYYETSPNLFDTDDDPLASYCLDFCNSLLMKLPSVDWSVVRQMKGYEVYPGDKDSFGWLTGCVQKIGSDKIIVFG